MNNIYTRLTFPHFILIKASAGTGKTFELSKRIASFLLSDILHNELRNILAITFTVNASKEMKQRVMQWFKRLALCDREALAQFEIPHDKVSEVVKKADSLLDEILTSYKDFQIKTIDSFLTSIFKSCATDFGYPEDFQILLNNRDCMKTAFDIYLRDIDSKDGYFFEMLDLINESESTTDFRPYDKIFKNVRSLYVKEKHHIKGLLSDKKEIQWQTITKEIKSISSCITNFIAVREIRLNRKCSLGDMLEDIKKGDWLRFFCRGDKISPILKQDEGKEWAEELKGLWQKLLQKRLEALYLYSERYYYPYIAVLRSYKDKLDAVKRSKQVLFIEDVPSLILENINNLNIPDVYIRLGGRLYHYFIDEFQDTSPIQYANLEPFIENSLSQGGSLFIVGDTKQAIYGFRDTDYEIMNRLSKENPFLSVSEYSVKTLDKNYRSGKVILDYAKAVFNKARIVEDYMHYGDSGLFDWKVEVKEGNEGKGYVLAKVIERQKDAEYPKEQVCITDIINDLINRGYAYSDIAILAHKNSHIVEVSSWLSDKEIPFISFSSLDIRNRRVIRELLLLLTFLDSPSDNLSFSSFLIGEIFSKLNTANELKEFIFKYKKERFLYTRFREQYPDLWSAYFEGAFNYVGYLPVYELLCYIIRVFEVNTNFAEESGAIARLLEILKGMEAEGKNSLKEFLDFIELQQDNDFETNSIFELPIPRNANAIRLMTVHKAKGLGFPVVIYLIYPLTKKSTESLKIHETEEGLRALKITKDIKRGKLEDIYDQIDKKVKINDLNSLYVGLTRAQDEMYLVGVAFQNEKAGIERDFPVDLIIEGEYGSKTHKTSKLLEPPEEIKMVFNQNPMIHDKAYGEIAHAEKRRGEATHLILSRVDDISGLDKDALISKISEAIRYSKTRFPEIDEEDYIEKTRDFLNNDKIRPFFECADKKVMIEKEYVDKSGNLLRIDRLIVGRDKVEIIDFKTGEIDGTYAEQLRHYADVIREIYRDKEVSCYILYFDSREVQSIR